MLDFENTLKNCGMGMQSKFFSAVVCQLQLSFAFSKPSVVSQTIHGQHFINISTGSCESEPLEPGVMCANDIEDS